MTEQDKKAIRKLQATLGNIDAGVKCFFNITQFSNMGLITKRNIWGRSPGSGNRTIIGTKYGLTDKGKMVLNTFV